MADYFYILRYRQMQFVGKGDPDHYSYKEVAKSTDRQFINSLIEKYRLKMINPKEFIDDGYEIVEEKLEDWVDYDYIVKHSDRKHVRTDDYNPEVLESIATEYQKAELPAFVRPFPKLFGV